MSEYIQPNKDLKDVVDAPPARLELNDSFNPEKSRLKSRLERFGGAVLGLVGRQIARSETIVMPEKSKAEAGLEVLRQSPDVVEAYSGESRELLDAVSEMAIHYNDSRTIDIRSLDDVGYSKETNFVLPEDLKSLKDGQPTTLPVDMFVGATGIDHFTEGRGGLKNGSSSKEVIKAYAKLPPPEGPSLSGVVIYVTPSGEAFAYVHGDGSHRLAAAKMRGDEMITAYSGSIKIRMLDSDVQWPVEVQLQHT